MTAPFDFDDENPGLTDEDTCEHGVPFDQECWDCNELNALEGDDDDDGDVGYD